jgi:catechol 2,3-dioxygenase-like lactoylglutathione lyase family enzyme
MPGTPKRIILKSAICAAVAALAFAAATTAAHAQDRPHILGISHLCVYSSDAAATDHFYGTIIGAAKGPDPEDPAGTRYYFSSTQFVEVLPLPANQGLSRMAHVAFITDDAAGLRAWLAAHGNADETPVKTGSDGTHWFETKDPEGNVVQFVQGESPNPPAPNVISTHVIHVGFMVHSRAAEDPFYKGLLGFRPYWYGAMRTDKVDWVSQQVPDGHDWLEYMLVGDGSTTPLDHIDAHELGVLNHFSLGVPNMEQAVTTLIAGDRLSPRHDGPQMGKDGKWQANLYDPDGTRVELMEFQPVVKPCCSGFTASSPVN